MNFGVGETSQYLSKFLNKVSVKQNIVIKNKEISYILVEGEEYFNLTEIGDLDEESRDDLVRSWMRNRLTLESLIVWEQINNSDFKGDALDTFRMEASLNSFNMTPKKWVESTNAIGIISKAGRYGGGTFAHRHLALHFAAWLNPEFNMRMIIELDRLKQEEVKRLKQGEKWDLRREFSKINYHIHTKAIETHIIPRHNLPAKNQGIIYASEADLLNKVVFDMTAAEWRLQNPEAKGNLRDIASDIQLTVLSNIESHNSELIKQGLDQAERFEILEKIASEQLTILYDHQQQAVFKSISARKKKGQSKTDPSV
jgi:KilA-N domain